MTMSETQKKISLNDNENSVNEVLNFSNCDVVKRVFFNFFCSFCKNLDMFNKEKSSDKYILYKKGN